MKSLVLADFHLGTDNIEDQGEIKDWVESTVAYIKPERVIFAGDTFELILPMEHSPEEDLRDKERVIGAIGNSWQGLFDYLRDSDVQKFVFVHGEHDFDITKPNLEQRLQGLLNGKDVSTSNHFYDAESSTLVIHGHELDYNRIFEIGGERISCIGGLTRALNDYLAQTPEVEKRVREATQRQDFSYWYGFSGLPRYIEAVDMLFGADRRVYEREVAKVIQSKDSDRWLAQQRSPLVQLMGRGTKKVAQIPSMLLPLYGAFYFVLDKVVESRVKAIVAQKPYTDAPDYCFRNPVNNLVLGHFHRPEESHYSGGSMFNVSSPRIHVDGIERSDLVIHRDLTFAVINGARVEYSSRTNRRRIPLASMTSGNGKRIK